MEQCVIIFSWMSFSIQVWNDYNEWWMQHHIASFHSNSGTRRWSVRKCILLSSSYRKSVLNGIFSVRVSDLFISHDCSSIRLLKSKYLDLEKRFHKFFIIFRSVQTLIFLTMQTLLNDYFKTEYLDKKCDTCGFACSEKKQKFTTIPR